MLDPNNWTAFREDAHRIVDRLIDEMERADERPTWQPLSQSAKDAIAQPLPIEGSSLREVFAEFASSILPYPTGNIHPRFWGWVHGSGTPAGALAELMAATMNSNVGGREHAAVYVERQVIRWFADLFKFGDAALGVLVGGASMANLIAVLVARTNALGREVRSTGIESAQLCGYASAATHNCVRRAFEISGLGSDNLRVLPVDSKHRMDLRALQAAVERDRATGKTPFLVVANAGSVDVGAIDPLEKIAGIAQEHKLWMHVDGAFGALLGLSEHLRPRIAGIERADSIAFDFHKWMHVPYDAACVLVKNGQLELDTFASEQPYLTRATRGLAAGTPWFTDLGPDLSRSFRALKVWVTLKHFGTQRIAEAIEANCKHAQLFERLIQESRHFEMAAPVYTNIAVFRLKDKPDSANDELAIAIQESGEAVLSTTTVDGRRALRACFTNHRTTEDDVRRVMEWLDKNAFSGPAA